MLVFLNFFSSAEERDSLSKRNPIRNNQGAQGQYFNERLMVLQNIIYAKDILGSGQADSGASSSIFLNSCLVAKVDGLRLVHLDACEVPRGC